VAARLTATRWNEHGDGDSGRAPGRGRRRHRAHPRRPDAARFARSPSAPRSRTRGASAGARAAWQTFALSALSARAITVESKPTLWLALAAVSLLAAIVAARAATPARARRGRGAIVRPFDLAWGDPFALRIAALALWEPRGATGGAGGRESRPRLESTW
jgi:hypothetical protein